MKLMLFGLVLIVVAGVIFFFDSVVPQVPRVTHVIVSFFPWFLYDASWSDRAGALLLIGFVCMWMGFLYVMIDELLKSR